MSTAFNTLIDYNLNLILRKNDIRKLEFKDLSGQTLSRELSVAVYDKLITEELISVDSVNRISLRAKAIEILGSGGWLNFIKEAEDKTEVEKNINIEKTNLELLNLKLQNENLVYAASIREKEEEIRRLTKTNLKYQILYVVVGAIIGAIGTYLAG